MSTTSEQDIFPSFRTVAALTAAVITALFAILPFVIAIATATVSAAQRNGAVADDASPIFGVTIPPRYRQWELIAPAEEANPLNFAPFSETDPRSTPIVPTLCHFPTGRFSSSWPGSVFGLLSSNRLRSRVRPQLCRSWSRTRGNMLLRAGGVSAALSTARPLTRRSTIHASLATRPV